MSQFFHIDFLPFDTYNILDIEKLRDVLIDLNLNNSELNDFVYIFTLIENNMLIKHPFLICDFFKLNMNEVSNRNVHELVNKISFQTSYELNNLIPGYQFKLDWENNNYGIFAKKIGI